MDCCPLGAEPLPKYDGHVTYQALVALLVFCAGNPPISGGGHKWPVMRSFDVYFKQSSWFETSWRSYDITVTNATVAGKNHLR